MDTSRNLDGWLTRVQSLHDAFLQLRQEGRPDIAGLGRVAAVRERLGLQFSVPVIIVAGTNGKGSTCAFIEAMALQAGWRVGTYTKPHLIRFEERCRVAGQPVDGDELVQHFEAVESARGETPLSYFEFTTLVIARCLALTPLDLVILEVGIGGRLDAVNVFDADCAVITSIDLDHMEILGPDREAIGREKAGIMRAGKPVIVCDPVPPASVVDAAQSVGADAWWVGRDFQFSGDRQQWAWSGRGKRYHALAYPALRGANQLLNASGALAALTALADQLPMNAQAVRNGLALVELLGRFQVLPGQPAVVLDVAHNPHAVAALARNLDQMGFFPRTHAVMGAMRDKDIPGMLEHLAPWVDHWYFTDLPTPRAASAAELTALRLACRVPGPQSATAKTFASPAEALAAARATADPADRIVVFGSFVTVGGVLQAVGSRQSGAPAVGG